MKFWTASCFLALGAASVSAQPMMATTTSLEGGVRAPPPNPAVVAATQYPTEQTKAQEVCAKFIEENPIEDADLTPLMGLVMGPMMGGMGPMGPGPMGPGPMGPAESGMGPGFPNGAGGRRLLQMMTTQVQAQAGVRPVDSTQTGVPRPPPPGAQNGMPRPTGAQNGVPPPGAQNGMPMPGPFPGMMGPPAFPCDDELALQLLCYGDEVVISKLMEQLTADLGMMAGANAGAAAGPGGRQGPMFTTTSLETPAEHKVDLVAVASTCDSREMIMQQRQTAGAAGRRLFQVPSLAQATAQTTAQTTGAQTTQGRPVPPTRECKDDADGQLAANSITCPTLLEMGLECRSDLSTLSPEVPTGTYVSLLCPKTCGMCPPTREELEAMRAEAEAECATKKPLIEALCETIEEAKPELALIARGCPLEGISGDHGAPEPAPECEPCESEAELVVNINAGFKKQKKAWCITDAGNAASFAVCDDSAADQAWVLHPMADGKFHIKSKTTGKCILPAGFLGACNDNALFEKLKNNQDKSYFALKNSQGKCLAPNLKKNKLAALNCAKPAQKKIAQLFQLQLDM